MGRIGVGGCGETTGRNSNKKYENQREGIKFKRKKYENTKRNIVSQFCKTTRNTFSYFRIFFSFAKRLKLGKTVPFFVQFRISRNLKKNTKLSTLHAEFDPAMPMPEYVIDTAESEYSMPKKLEFPQNIFNT